MEEKFIQIIKEKPIVVPKIIFQNYQKLNITAEELIILIWIINKGDKIIYNPEILSQELGLNKFKVMELVASLLEKKIISLEVDKKAKMAEYLSLELFYTKIFNIILAKEESKENFENIFSIFEEEFGRTLSPMEYEIINGWLNDKIPLNLITLALKEATYNGVSNLRYIEKILFEWKKKGYKTKIDVMKDKQKIKPKTKNVPIFDYNWLEDE